MSEAGKCDLYLIDGPYWHAMTVDGPYLPALAGVAQLRASAAAAADKLNLYVQPAVITEITHGRPRDTLMVSRLMTSPFSIHSKISHCNGNSVYIFLIWE